MNDCRQARLAWLHEPRMPQDGSLPQGLCLSKNMGSPSGEFREGIQAIRFRQQLVARYGQQHGNAIRFAEAFSACEYGSPLTEENEKTLFPF